MKPPTPKPTLKTSYNPIYFFGVGSKILMILLFIATGFTHHSIKNIFLPHVEVKETEQTEIINIVKSRLYIMPIFTPTVGENVYVFTFTYSNATSITFTSRPIYFKQEE